MSVAIFFDGSFPHATRGVPEVMSLAGICATNEAWLRFHSTWRPLLEKYGLLKYGLHTADMMAGIPPYERWTEDKKRSLIAAASGAFATLTPDVRSCVCSVDIADHRRLKSEDPWLITPESICVDQSFNGCAWVDRGEEDASNTIHLHFDNNEPFMHKIRRVWEAKRRDPSTGWPRQISDISAIDRETSYAIQAVDLLVWLDHRHHTYKDVNIERQLIGFTSFCSFRFMTYDKIKSMPKFFREGDEDNR
jgi:hypothetical protein